MTLRRTLLTVSALVLAATSGAALAQDVAREDTVIFDLDRTIKDPENFNWFTPGTKRMHGAHQAMWEPLFILNYGTGELEPWLASGFEGNETNDEFTVTLREGVEWSDGEAFNADDVVFTVNMALENEEISSREAATIRAQVASVEKIDDLTVRFNLNAPNPRFLVENFGVRIFGSFLIMPEHIWAGQDPATFAFFPPIGTGPYTYTSSATNRAIWDRNDDWWGAKTGFMDLPEPLRLIFLETGGEESRAQLIATNQMDAAQNVSVGTFEAIRFQNPNVIAWYSDYPYAAADPCARQLEINTTVAPWDSAAMRKAVSLIIDRNQIVNVAAEGATVASETMFAQYGSMAPFIDAVKAAGFGLSDEPDLEAAAALIEGEGWAKNGDGFYEKDGEVLSVDIHVNSASTEYTRTIDVVAEQLTRAGIQARSVPVENGVFWGEVLPFGTFEMSYSWLSCGSVNEPWASMGRYTVKDVVPVGERSPGFNNTARWDGPAAEAYSAIVDEIAKRPLGDPEVPELVAEAYQYLDAEMPFIPLVQSAKLLPMNTTYWTGWPTSENYYNHPFFWWNHTHQIIHNLEKVE
ncbi:ABC transporter related [Dinoroseobacter shibae DFL 12 = DSM 16493]|jgi:peptide/nickel transport system substrate-binding protein|uniref:ABC transporter related n=1 Tax=Dinoroseobacter shibae (strain DSM 16493 / NCIMB 14021 / DFL 12) TaxID=398580 RepID=A8LKG1_DINSH|nr:MULTISPECIES: ABC transporter substrate-binding protein [Dinoroseobacter]ABV94744.1 ABC transporter related [Dinoroseobacter shibae DFL 12 = DSM 16493]MDD9716814.1 ABC transporter substrate-binding protein [Dinoroseobacter sp. PD6]URF46165.1 ABC transporter substrate-binding protein [Dinoroseobacter shibae]URF50472.1 ABC transporter substrate-binding protein [Dinoroseobacter shibae]